MPASLQTASLLVVDDDLEVIMHLTRACAEAPSPLMVIGNVSGADILACIDAYQPDAVLLDLALPRACGFDLLRTIRAARPALPVAMLSAHAREPAIETCLHLGARAYFVKPRSDTGWDSIARALGNGVAGRGFAA